MSNYYQVRACPPSTSVRYDRTPTWPRLVLREQVPKGDALRRQLTAHGRAPSADIAAPPSSLLTHGKPQGRGAWSKHGPGQRKGNQETRDSLARSHLSFKFTKGSGHRSHSHATYRAASRKMVLATCAGSGTERDCAAKGHRWVTRARTRRKVLECRSCARWRLVRRRESRGDRVAQAVADGEGR